MTIERILVPIDGSSGAQSALDCAIDFLPAHPAELLIVLAIEPIHLAIAGQVTLPGENVGMIANEQQILAGQHLAKLENDLRGRNLRVRTFLERGSAEDVILKIARKQGADLIVMSTHARTGIAHALLGSITEKIIRSAPCPVLTVRGYVSKAKKKGRG